MIYELSQKFFFEAAHMLDRDIDADASRRMHGHTYHAQVTISGDPDPATGMVNDLGHIRNEIATVRNMLDHRLLNEVPGLNYATMEDLCRFIFVNLQKSLPTIVQVTIERKASGDSCMLRKSA